MPFVKDFMRDFLELEHMEKVKLLIRLADSYLVHHCVLTPKSCSTCLHVVLNASAKIVGQISLNECPMTGPKLQSKICKTLLNIHLFSSTFYMDIKHMYQIICMQRNL